MLPNASFTGTAVERLTLLSAAQEHVLAEGDSKNRLMQAIGELSKALVLAVSAASQNTTRPPAGGPALRRNR
ncbi:MAG: hypothetical protein AB1547_12600 [Thermodesulfobacteriota bacterium]